MGLTIGVDVGGTKVAAGVVDTEGRILEQVRRDTPGSSAEAVDECIAGVVLDLATSYDVEAVGVGAPGFIDADRSKVLIAPNLPWRDQPLREVVEKRTGLPAVVENDANAAAWAEARFGAGRGAEFVVAVTVGTGIGGGIVVDGHLYRGRFGVAAEIGHLNAVPDGRRCGCGLRGCWEQYASGRALVREARELATESPAVAARLLELGGGTPDGIGGYEITQAAQEGDPGALDCFRRIAYWLGHGMAELAAVLDPAVFVIGGGVSEAGELLRGAAERAYQEQLTGHGHRPYAAVRLAEMGQDAGIVGAADLARQR